MSATARVENPHCPLENAICCINFGSGSGFSETSVLENNVHNIQQHIQMWCGSVPHGLVCIYIRQGVQAQANNATVHLLTSVPMIRSVLASRGQKIGTEKNHDSHRRDRILRIFLGRFSY